MNQASIDHLSRRASAHELEFRGGGANRRFVTLRRGTAAAAVAAAAIAGGAAGPAIAASSGITAKLSPAPSHTPPVGGEKITILVTKGTQKLRGSVKYQFLFEGQLVNSQPGKTFKNGVYHDTLQWPAAAIGKKLTVKMIITTNAGTTSLSYWFEVKG
jgi:hypothetical protein